MIRGIVGGVAVCAALACAGPAAAQQSIDSATITGRVTDPSGTALAGAQVRMRSIERNQTRETRADGNGRFSFLYLAPGPYELVIEAEGFAQRAMPIVVTLGQALDVPITLALANITAAIEVRAGAPLVETRRTQAADTVRPADVDVLPLNGRNYLDLTLLVPGVSRTVQRNTERFAETSAVPGTGISVSSQRNLNNTFIVDGLSANDDAAGLAGTYFAQEAIRELQVVTSGGVAEFGRSSSGIISIVTQSGSNDMRGRAYGFFRNDVFDARNPLARREDPLGQEQFGFTMSGPLMRDRTFWFGNVERTDFDRTGVITIDPVSVDTINAALDLAGYGGPRVATGEFPTGYETTNAFGRVDHTLGGGSRLSARYSFYDVASENARNVGGLNAASRGTRLDSRDQTGAVSLLGALSSTAFNELRGQVTRSRLAAPTNDVIGPAVNISGVASFGTATFSPTRRDLDVIEITDSLTLSRGDHLLKAGGSLLYERLDIEFPGARQGVYQFASLAALASGRYTNFQQVFGEAVQFQTSANLGAFVQDEWRPIPALTVNMGLRYDVQALADPIEADRDNVSPRVGVALAPGDGRTVLRATAGFYFDRIPLRAVSNALQRDGVKYRTALVTPGQPGAPTFPDVLAEFPPDVLTNVTSIDPSIENGMSRQANLEIERALGRRLAATIGYTHLSGRHIIMSHNINVPTLTAAEAAMLGVPNLGRPDPTTGNNAQYQSIGHSDSNALTVSLRSSSARWATLRVAYTLSKALDDAGNAFFSSPQDSFDVRDDYGRSDNDQRHRLVIGGTTPIWKGIELAYLYSYASAPPFNVQTGTDRNHDTNVNDRPASVGRNTGEGFDSSTLDVRVSKAFALGGPHRLDVMVDAFNVLNRTNFLIPNNIFGPGTSPLPSFGRPTAAGDPRQLQLGVRWSF